MKKSRSLSRFCRRPIALSAVLFLCAISESPANPTCRVAPELWDRPRTGRIVLVENSLKPCVAALASQPGTKLLVHHGGGAEAVLQAEELRAWLVALAIDAGRIELVNDLKSTEPLDMEIIAAGADAQRAPSEAK